jgi:pyruvate/2-oxoglutarate/acetoin dehydrogenase E1 component
MPPTDSSRRAFSLPPIVHRTLNVADRLAVEDICAEVVDPGTIVPLNKKRLKESHYEALTHRAETSPGA